jgi:hypothetical protein
MGKFVRGDAADPVPFHGDPLDIAVGLELLYGLPDRGAADAELLRDLTVGEGGFGLEITEDDGLAEVFVNDVPHRLGTEIGNVFQQGHCRSSGKKIFVFSDKIWILDPVSISYNIPGKEKCKVV